LSSKTDAVGVCPDESLTTFFFVFNCAVSAGEVLMLITFCVYMRA